MATILVCLITKEHASNLLRVYVVYMRDIFAYTDCVFLYLPKVADLKQQLHDAEDGLKHYENLVSLK